MFDIFLIGTVYTMLNVYVPVKCMSLLTQEKKWHIPPDGDSSQGQGRMKLYTWCKQNTREKVKIADKLMKKFVKNAEIKLID